MSKQLQIFPLTDGGQLTVNRQTDPLHGFASQEEYDENLSIWLEVVMQNEREQEEELQIWFDIMMGREREQDEEFREEMYLYMDHTLRGNNGSGVITGRRTGSRNKRQQQMLSRKLHTCNRQENGLK